MSILSVDYGDAHTGIAVSDASHTIVAHAFVLHEKSTERLLEQLKDCVETFGVTRIVLGFPKNMNGTLGPRAEKTRVLSERLTEITGLPVVLWDERRTTADAYRILDEKKRRKRSREKLVDAVAASLLLEGYLTFCRANPG